MRTIPLALTTFAVLLSLGMATANATTHADSAGNIVNFSVASSADVSNDEATARFSKDAQAKDAAALAVLLNPTINKALDITKKYPSIRASTGNQSSYPRYDNKGKIIGVQGSAGLVLKSQNIDDLSRAIAEIQTLMTLDDLSFQVSDAQTERVKQQLMGETVAKFKSQANALSHAWGAKSYRLIQADMNTSAHQPERPYYGVAMAEVAADASAPRQELQAGESTIRYTINGTIQLLY